MSPTQVDVSWTDLSSDEIGFEVERSANGGAWVAAGSAAADAIRYSDATAAPETDYGYRVRAFNAAGSSAWADTAGVTTPQGVALSAHGWSGAGSANVEVIRDGSPLTTTPNDGTHTDTVPGKGGGSFDYRVCETGSGRCSPTVTVAF